MIKITFENRPVATPKLSNEINNLKKVELSLGTLGPTRDAGYGCRVNIVIKI